MANEKVRLESEEWNIMSPFWQMIRDIRAGTKAMRDAGKLYMPQEPAEGETAFFNRLSRSVFTNFYKKSVDVFVGRPLKDPVVLDDDVPEDIVELMDNIDLLGNDITVFARNILQQALDDGATHIIVDFPPTDDITGDMPDGALTLEQENRFGIRPYAIHVKPLEAIGWKFEVALSGEKILTQFRYLEAVKRQDPDNPFAQITIERVRVHEPGLVNVWENQAPKDKDADWVVVETHFTSLTFIPIVTLYANRVGFMLGSPTLLDFAYLNVAHWQSDSDQRNIVHVARVPILFGTGLGMGEEGQAAFTLEVGVSTMTKGPKGSTLTYVEHTGAGVKSGQDDLNDLVERMEAIASGFIVKRPAGTVTATGKVIDQAENESDLGLIARELESALENILDLFGVWMNKGEEAGGGVSVFKDFGVTIGASTDLDLLQKDRAAGDISLDTYWAEQKRRGILSDDFDPEEEKDLLDAEGPRDPIDESTLQGESNAVGDQTGAADGHQHRLEDDGTTSEVDGHSHTWDPNGTQTGSTNGHSHPLPGRAAAVNGE